MADEVVQNDKQSAYLIHQSAALHTFLLLLLRLLLLRLASSCLGIPRFTSQIIATSQVILTTIIVSVVAATHC